MKKQRAEVLNGIRNEIKCRFVEVGVNWNKLPDIAFPELEKVARGKKLLIIRRLPGECDCCHKPRWTGATYARPKKTLYELYGL